MKGEPQGSFTVLFDGLSVVIRTIFGANANGLRDLIFSLISLTLSPCSCLFKQPWQVQDSAQ